MRSRDEGTGRPKSRALDRELARSPIWDVGQWNEARWWDEAAHSRTLAEDLIAAVRAPGRRELSAALVALAGHPLLVSPWVAVPEVRAMVAALGNSAAGRLVRRDVFPLLCRFALRLAWAEVSPQPAADLYATAGRLHTRAMAHMVGLLRTVADDPDSFANVIEHALPRDRELLVSELLGSSWRAKRAAMLGCRPGTLRLRRWRLRTRNASRKPKSGVVTES